MPVGLSWLIIMQCGVLVRVEGEVAEASFLYERVYMR
jgi:hypothetical protein